MLIGIGLLRVHPIGDLLSLAEAVKMVSSSKHLRDGAAIARSGQMK
jgi:hypothetical protein